MTTKKKTMRRVAKTKRKAAPRKVTATIPAPYTLAPGKALMLRTCDAKLRAHGGFQWPASGPVSAPDWNPRPVCGGGLHGLLYGEGDVSYLSTATDAKWLVVEVDASSVVSIDGDKVKVPRGNVVFCGERDAAVAFLVTHAPGYKTAFAHKTAGYRGTATAGDRGTATAGDRGTATAGDFGTATAGDFGTATAGDHGTATAGYRGIVVIKWWNGSRYKLAVRYVGEDGIKAGVPYRCDESGNVVEAKEGA